MSIEAMKQALETLEHIDYEDNDRDFLFPYQCDKLDAAITALRAAIEQAEKQEPVAWMIWTHGPVLVFMNKDEAMMEFERLNTAYPEQSRKLRPLYTTPPAAPAQAPECPDGYKLVMVEIDAPRNEPDWDECIRQAELSTGIKVERNTLSIIIREVRRWLLSTTPGGRQSEDCLTAAPVQEPVAWMYKDKYGNLNQSSSPTVPPDSFPVYTTPPAAPVQEPVAWGNLANWCLDSDRVLITDKTEAEKYHRDVYDLTPLYTHPAPAAPVQEPVAWVWNPAKEAWEQVRAFGHWQQGAIYAFGPTPPAAQRQWVGLTDEEVVKAMPGGIYDCLNDPWDCGVGDGDTLRSIKNDVLRIARAIEAKLRSKNGGDK